MLDCWEDNKSRLLSNPSYSEKEQAYFQTILQATTDWPGHFWLSTSGSQSPKWVGLSKRAILASAQAVNLHLQSHSSDCWIQSLPSFHVGGLGIWARAYLSGARVANFRSTNPGKWQAHNFYDYVQEQKGTLSALVPAQIYDLVGLQKRAPASLRAVIVGGGALAPSLYAQAIRLGWPILPSYGLTECASQVGTAELKRSFSEDYPQLKLLSHIAAREFSGCLAFKGESMLSLYAYPSQAGVLLKDPKQEGWFISEDRGSVQMGCLQIEGRADALVKIGGESVDLARLETYLHDLRLQLSIDHELVLIPFPDERLGVVIHLVIEGSVSSHTSKLIECFNQIVLPFERIRHIHSLHTFPRSAIGKVLKETLKSQLSNGG